MLSLTFGTLFPVFGLILIGFVCGRSGVLGDNADGVLNRFVVELTLPALTFRTLAMVAPGDLAVPAMFAAVVGGGWAVYGLAFAAERMLGKRARQANIAALCASYGNTAFIGLPICLALMGQAAMGPSAIVMALNTAFVFGGGVLMSEMTREGHHSLAAALRSVGRLLATNPLILASGAGVVVAWTRWRLPGPLDVLLHTLGGATGPCALVAVGIFTARPLASGKPGTLLRGLAGKLVLSPLVTLGLFWLLPPLPPVWLVTTVLMAGMPGAATTFVLASLDGEESRQVAATGIVLSTVGAAVTIPAMIAALAMAGIFPLAAAR